MPCVAGSCLHGGLSAGQRLWHPACLRGLPITVNGMDGVQNHSDLPYSTCQVRVVDEPGWSSWVEHAKRRLGLMPIEHLVLLDVGMVAELSREDQLNLVHFFKVSKCQVALEMGKAQDVPGRAGSTPSGFSRSLCASVLTSMHRQFLAALANTETT